MKVKLALLSIAIALLFAFFVGYGIEVFSESPDFEEVCPRLWDVEDKDKCEELGGIWESEVAEPVPKAKICRNSEDCYVQYDVIRSSHDMIVFIVSLIVGISAIVVGYILKKESVNTGILSGGVLLVLYGTIRYWQHANDILKFVLLGIALAVLIWFAYKKLK